jgi:hypothetical protein
MSVPVSAWFQNAYIRGATHVLQSKGWMLKGTFREPDRILGKTAYWRVAGAGVAVPLSDSIEQLTPMNLDRSTVNGVLTDWQAADWIKHPDINSMSENEQEVTQKSAAMALGRKFDRLVIEALDADTNIPTIGNGSAAISIIDVITAAGQIMGSGWVDELELFCPLPQVMWNQLLLYREFSSSDYVGPEYPLSKMTLTKKFGFVTYFLVPDSTLTVPATNQMDAYMWAKSAIGFSTNYDMQSRITWENLYTAYLANNWMSGVAKPILGGATGAIRRLRFATNVALSRPTP